MKDAVVIKGNKAGMTVYLDKDLNFEEVLQAIAKKFKATEKFWGAAQMTLTLEGRELTPEEEYRVVQTIMPGWTLSWPSWRAYSKTTGSATAL